MKNEWKCLKCGRIFYNEQDAVDHAHGLIIYWNTNQ